MGSTIADFDNLCNADIVSENSSPNTKKNEKQIQLLSSADQLPKSMRHQNGNSGKKKKKRKNKKSSKKNSGNKTPAFSFEYNRGTVSSKNKKARLGSKKKKKKEKLGKKKKKKKKKK